MTLTRRKLLGGVAGVAGSSVAGCASSLGLGCGRSRESRIEVDREAPQEYKRDEVAPIRVGELSADEREIASTAIREGSYAECAPESRAFASLLDRIDRHQDDQQLHSDLDLPTVYFRRDAIYYEIYAVVGERTVST